MADEHEAPLAATLAAIMRSEHVTITHVTGHSGLAHNVVKYILSGKTRQPTPRTLALIAGAVATDDYTGERDHEKARELERMLSVAAGYADPTAREARTMLERLLYYVLASREKARAWAEVIVALRDAAPEVVRTLPRLLRRASTSGS